MEKNTRVYGIHAVNEAINAGEDLEKIYIQKDLQNTSLQEIEHSSRSNAIPVSYVPIEKLDKLSKYQNHQGVVANISPITYLTIEDLLEHISNDAPLLLLLDQISDVRNFGAIIRTAECCGVDGIIIPAKGGAPVNADTIKTSAGAAFNIPICKVDHIKDAMFFLQAHEYTTIAATEKTNELVYDVDFTKPTALIMGSEGKGITPSILKLVDHKVKLPIYGEISSLNVSVACGAVLYEAVRQRL